jgi:pimeloyl-ACP methyl ester carboxylesterase
MSVRRPLFQWLKRAALVLLVLFAVSALLEHGLEARDKAAATANDTFFTVNGKRIRYLLSGADQPGPTIVLVSGLIASLEQWASVQAALSHHASVLSYDRAGTGFSDTSSAHDAAAEAEELAALMQAPRVSRECIVVGFSASAFVARVFAAQHPELVKGLVLIDPATRDDHAVFPPYKRISYKRDFARMLISSSVQALLGVGRIRLYLSARAAPPKTPAAQKAQFILASFHHWSAATLDGLSLDTSARQADTVPALHDIPVGVLSTIDPDLDRDSYSQQQQLAHYPRGRFRSVEHLDHSDLLEAGTNTQAINLILEIQQQARATAP